MRDPRSRACFKRGGAPHNSDMGVGVEEAAEKKRAQAKMTFERKWGNATSTMDQSIAHMIAWECAIIAVAVAALRPPIFLVRKSPLHVPTISWGRCALAAAIAIVVTVAMLQRYAEVYPLRFRPRALRRWREVSYGWT